MSAEIIILPIIRVERPQRSEEFILPLHLHPRTAARLRNRAREWNLSEAEAAEMLLDEALDPRRMR